MLRAIDVVREFWPDLDDISADHIIWAFTGWPCFWRDTYPELPKRQRLIESLRADLRRLYATVASGKPWEQIYYESWEKPLEDLRLADQEKLRTAT